MIDLDKKIIFIHITKTGGRSMHEMLKKMGCNLKHDSRHSSLNEHKKFIKEGDINNFYKFSVVRNPWSRFVSMYHYYYLQHKSEDFWDNNKWDLPFKDWLQHIFSGNFNRNLNHQNLNTFKYHFHQINFLKDESNNMVNMDYILRFENYKNDFIELREKLNLPKCDLLHINKTSHSFYKDYYDNDTKNIILKNCEEEIDFFKYTF